jgi:hypothetical protein
MKNAMFLDKPSRKCFLPYIFLFCRISGFHSGGYEERYLLGYNAV